MSASTPQKSAKLPVSSGALSLCILVMLVHMAISGGRVAVTLSALQLGRSTFEVGVLIAVFALLPMVFSVKAGRLIDAIGPYRPMQICALLVCAGAVLPFIWQDLTTLIIAAVCIGVGHMVFQIAVQGQVGIGSTEQRLRNFSMLSLTISISGFFGPLITGFSIDYLGHRWAFALLAIGPAVAAYGVRKLQTKLVAAHDSAAHETGKRRIMDLLRVKSLQRIFVANVLLSSAWDTHMFVVPIYGVNIGLSATTIGIILASFAIATVMVRLCLPLIQKHMNPWRLIHIAMVAAGLNFMIYPFCSQVWLCMLMSFLLGIALGSTQPGILSLLQQHAPIGRTSEAFGLRMALINMCQVSLPLAFGALGTVTGVMPLFWVTGLSLGIGRWATRHEAKTPAPSNIENPD
jgi:MFS family permease